MPLLETNDKLQVFSRTSSAAKRQEAQRLESSCILDHLEPVRQLIIQIPFNECKFEYIKKVLNAFPISSGDVKSYFFRESNMQCSAELQLSVFLNHNISTPLTFGVKINTLKEAEWQSPAVLAGYLQDIKEGKKCTVYLEVQILAFQWCTDGFK